MIHKGNSSEKSSLPKVAHSLKGEGFGERYRFATGKPLRPQVSPTLRRYVTDKFLVLRICPTFRFMIAALLRAASKTFGLIF